AHLGAAPRPPGRRPRRRQAVRPGRPAQPGKTPMKVIDRGDAARVTTHYGPDHLVISEHPVLRRFWYAACFAADVSAAPTARTVLGTRLVLWRPSPDAPVSVALDRCAHRDAPLSKGWVANCRLVCAYHGWEWDARGKTRRIPQFPGSPRPT